MPILRASFRFGRIPLTLLGLLTACAAHPIPVSGGEISAALKGNTALLPGGFAEYYAPDGKLHGMSDGQPYEGTWEVKGDQFCTALSGDPEMCAVVGRDGDSLYWSLDGEKKLSRVSTILPGNPRNLK